MAIILIVFIIGAGGYFTFTRFKSDVASVSASPTPSPSPLEFVLNKTPDPAAAQNNQPVGGTQVGQQNIQKPATPAPAAQAQATPRPYFINKNVGKFPGVLTADSLKNKKVVMQTNRGTIEIEIFTDTPIASSNFLLLADGGFYDGLKFHRVEDWVIQGGDPLGNGTGGPGYLFQDEAVSRSYTKGIVAMANAGPNTNGSQFFILKNDYSLPPNYTIFGQVMTGMDVVEKIAVGDVMQKVTVDKLQ